MTDPSVDSSGGQRIPRTAVLGIDVLDAGGSVSMTLTADGSTTGMLFVPAGVGGEEEEFQADLAGTWIFLFDPPRVTFEQAADTFIRDVTFLVSEADGTIGLSGEETFLDGEAIELVLTSD